MVSNHTRSWTLAVSRVMLRRRIWAAINIPTPRERPSRLSPLLAIVPAA